MSAGVMPASAKAIGPVRAAPDVVEIEGAAGEMLHRFAGADDLHQRTLELFGDLRLDDDESATAVADDAAVKPVQRIGDHRRVDHVLDGDDVGQHGIRIVARVMRSRDLDPGELFAGGAVLMHVAHGAHGVAIRSRQPIRKFPRRFRLVRIAQPRRGAGRLTFAARPAGERDQRNIALAECDGLGGMRGERHIGGAAEFGGIDVAKFQIHVLGHGGRPRARRIAGAEIAVDVVSAQPCIIQRTECHLSVKLRHRLIRRMPGRMLIGSGDIGLTLDCHSRTSPARATVTRIERKRNPATTVGQQGGLRWSWA